MINPWGFAALVVVFALAVPPAISAQQVWRLAQAPKAKGPAKKAAPPAEPEEVEELTPDQIRRAQEPAAPVPPPGRPAAPKPPAAPKQPKQAMPPLPRAVACSGIFAKDSNLLKLATVFGSENVTMGEVEGTGGGKIKAAILFPNEARRRLEVIWTSETTRAGVAVIAINGQSAWTGPKGVSLKMPVASIERINGKPFKLGILDKDNSSTVSDWQGGALEKVPGDCKVGVRFALDPRTAAPARAAMADSAPDYASTDPKVRALRLTVAEILIGY